MTPTIMIIALLAAIVATVLAFIYIVPESKRAGLNKFGQFLHDTLNFKYLIIEKILQAMYIFATASVLITGFCMLFYVEEGYSSYYYSTSDTWYGGYGLLTMILGPIVVRIAYEFLMMAILLTKNVIQINNKTKNENGNNNASAFDMPNMNEYRAQPNPTNYSQPNPMGYSQQNPMGYAQQPSRGYAQPKPTDYTQPKPAVDVVPKPADNAQPNSTAYAKPSNTGRFCYNCGSVLDADGTCPKCKK